MHRLQKILRQISNGNTLFEQKKRERRAKKESLPKAVRWDGWGYKDTEFRVNSKGDIEIIGGRYLYSGKTLPALRKFFEEEGGWDVKITSPSQPLPELPVPVRNPHFLTAVENHHGKLSFETLDRVHHAHGHACQEIWLLRFSKFPRVPDAVIWPRCHEDVEVMVREAKKHDVVIIPYGGGTSVTHGLLCPEKEARMIISLDMRMMNRIKWVDRESMLACIEGGAVGVDIENKLSAFNMCIGHEPDSIEFSTMGGWVATRASGMRKNRYGNIEDIVRRIKMVTPAGTVERDTNSPRLSSGPDINHMIMGSEGILGVVTECVVKICERPAVRHYGSVVFPDFESGVRFMYDLAMERAAPVSVRLMDNVQFRFGKALQPAVKDVTKHLIGKAQKWYLLNKLKFDPYKMTAATLLFEGSHEEVARQERKLYAIAKRHGGIKGGEGNGLRGYFLTYMIAYLRDFGFSYQFICESFETSVPWAKVSPLCKAVKARINEVAAQHKTKHKPFVCLRVTQTYPTGACIYFYFGFVWDGLKDPVHTFESVEHAAREEIMKHGGSISHHHGVGKCRKQYMRRTVGDTGMLMLKSLKGTLDPTNVFAANNLIDTPTPPRQ